MPASTKFLTFLLIAGHSDQDLKEYQPANQKQLQRYKKKTQDLRFDQEGIIVPDCFGLSKQLLEEEKDNEEE